MNSLAKRVLVTGATGLIGKELIEPLKSRGFEIYALAIEKDLPNNDVNWLRVNLFDFDAVKEALNLVKPQYLLNMAWATTGDYLSSNINFDFLSAGLNLLKCFNENGGKRAVFAGTCFEYKFKDEPLKETDELDVDKTVYTFCKHKLHEIAQKYCELNDISFAYGRIFYVYGRNEAKTRLTGMLLDKLSKGEQVVIKSGKLYKDYICAKDIAGAFSAILDSNVGGAINICTGKAVSIEEYARLIARRFGREDLLVFKDEPSNQPPLIVGDNSRLVNEVLYRLKFEDIALDEVFGSCDE